MEKYSIGFDIGGTKTAVSVGRIDDARIEVLFREETPTLASPISTLEKFLPLVCKWIKTYDVHCAGVNCGGPLNSQEGIIGCPPNLDRGWHGFSIKEYIFKQTGLFAKLQNDANACALAEWKFGAGRGTKNMVFCTFGTGLGAGLVLDGKLYGGTNDNAGEIGHIRLTKRGPFGYGKEGSFEGYCSGGGISRLAGVIANKCKKPPSYLYNGQNQISISTKKLAEYALKGDDFAKKVFAKSGEMLGKGLSTVIDILNPEKIVLGGVFMRCSALLIPSMQKALKKETLKESLEVCSIVPAELKENVGDIAALVVGSEL